MLKGAKGQVARWNPGPLTPGQVGPIWPGGGKAAAAELWAMVWRKGAGKQKGPKGKAKGKVATKIAAGEAAFVGRVRSYNAEKSFGLISCPECWTLCQKEVYAYKTVLASCGATVGDTVAFMVHWNPKGQPQASAYPEILRICNAQGDMALRGVFKWGPDEKFGFIENAQVQEYFGRDTYVRKDLADTLIPQGAVAFNIKLNKDYQPCAHEAFVCEEDWEPAPGDISLTLEDPTVLPPWVEQQKEEVQACTPTGEHLEAVIKVFHGSKGWGFLVSEELTARFGCDVFVHKNQMMQCPLRAPGTNVTFDLGLTEDGKPQAMNVCLGEGMPWKRQKLEEAGQDEIQEEEVPD